MAALPDGRLRGLATRTRLPGTKASSPGWVAGADARTLKPTTRAKAHPMPAERNPPDAPEANERKGENDER